MRTITIRTTQNVSIEYELAGSTSRVFAFAIDAFIVAGGYLLFLALFLDRVRLGYELVAILLPLTIFLVYYFCCELLMQGQTIGKRVQGLKVVRADGKDPTPADHLLRTFFLLPDAWFSLGVPAVLLINTTPRSQRLGDMVSNTVVIKTKGTQTFQLGDILSIQSRQDYEPQFPAIQQFSEEDMLLIKHTLGRAQLYRNPAHDQALQRLAELCREKLNLEDSAKHRKPEELLRTLLRDYIVLTR